MQHKIRSDALEQSAALSSLKDWKASIAAKDAALRKAAPPSQPSTGDVAPAPRKGSATPAPSIVAGPTGDAHTYDKGYSKWESFDVVSEGCKACAGFVETLLKRQAQDAALAASEDDGADAVPSVTASKSLLSPADVGTASQRTTAPVARSVRKTVLKSGIANDSACISPPCICVHNTLRRPRLHRIGPC